MEDKVRNVSEMMARERASKRKSIRGSIVAKERLLRTILRSIIRPRNIFFICFQFCFYG
jgi:hypothetical protein